MKTNHLIILTAVFFAQLFSSCKKEETLVPPTNNGNNTTLTTNRPPVTMAPTLATVTAKAQDKTHINSLVFKSMFIAFGAGMGDINHFKNADAQSSCAVITIDSSVSPSNVTIDFGTSGCTLDDGTPVTGIISGTFTGDLAIAGNTAVLDMNNFTINGNLLGGTFTIHNNGDASGNYIWSVDVAGGSLEYGSDGRIVKQSVDWDVELFLNDVADRTDDMYSFTGTSSGQTSDGDNYTELITDPLIVKGGPGCVHEFVQGISVMTIVAQPNLTINYGTGACDLNAEASQNGVRTTITLKAH